MDLLRMDASGIRDAVAAKQISAEAATQFFLQRIQQLNPKLNAFICVRDEALAEARAVDARLAQGHTPRKLEGVPVGIKDLLCTKGTATTAGSNILRGYVPPYTATVVEKLQNEGAIVLGKLNLDEFAMGSSNETSAFGPCRNPWNLDCVPGGSSGGSAAAVAARLVPMAIGTDTGGSIRQPASFCNLHGLKPTYGRVSRYGIIAFASSLDQAGAMTLSSRDCALMTEVISGYDPKDATSSTREVPRWSDLQPGSLAGLRIGLPRQHWADGTDSEVLAACEGVRRILEAAGATCREVDLSLTAAGVPIYYLIATSEASSNLARYDGVRFGLRVEGPNGGNESLDDFYSATRGQGFGSEVKRRIMLGTYALSSGFYDAYFKKAAQVRRLVRDEFMSVFQGVDLLLGPVTTGPAFRLGDRISDPLAMYMNDVFTTATNLAGLPGMSIPAGFTQSGLPIGAQLMAGHFREDHLIAASHVVDRELRLSERVPHEL